jgi:hypothetical protein
MSGTAPRNECRLSGAIAPKRRIDIDFRELMNEEDATPCQTIRN